MPFLRRWTVNLATILILRVACGTAYAAEPSGADSLESLQPMGLLIRECSLAGETRRDRVVPRHANAIQLSNQRWLVIYSTHGYRGVDDERSIVYQIRRDAPDGPVLKEGFFSRAIMDWRPAGSPPAPEGKVWFKQHGHMVAFGVPRGAMIASSDSLTASVPAHANVFVAMWRVLARPYSRTTDLLDKADRDSEMTRLTKVVEWVQFRLNDKEDDIEILQPVERLRQKGFEKGEPFCSHADAAWMNQSFCPPVPLDDQLSEWGVCDHFDQGRLAVVRMRFHPESKRYEWVETSPWLSAPKRELFEASLVRITPTSWLISARTNGVVAWATSGDPLRGWSDVTFSSEPKVSSPHTTFLCADGVVRLLSGDASVSPHKNARDPLYLWDIRPGSPAEASNRRVIFDSVAAGLPIRKAAVPKIDFGEIFPHHGGTQLVVHGVSTRAYHHAYELRNDIPALNDEEFAAAGVYYARIKYRKEPPPLWRFAP